ncbi:MAG: hypothetical protein AAFN65_07595, partial [Bacteroidota bacterium]
YDSDGNLIDNDDDGGSGLLSSLSAVGLSAGTYYLAIGEFNTNFGGANFNVTGSDSFDTLSYSLQAATFACDATFPTNDLCADAITLMDGVTVTGNTSLATADSSATAEDCFDGDSDEPGIWYTYTPVSTGNLRVVVCVDTLEAWEFRAFSGTCDSLFCEEGEDDDCLSGGIVNMPVTAGTQYFFLVNAEGDNPFNQFDDFDFTVTEVPAPENDACVDAIMVELGEMVSGNTENAASENDITITGNSCSSPSIGNNDDQGIWYSFVAPSQPVTIMAMGFDSIEVALHAGSCDSLDCLEDEEDMGSDSTSNDGMIIIPDVQLNEGETYLVYVEGLNGANGMFMVEACIPDLACNDTTVFLDEMGSLITIDPSFVASASCDSADFVLSATEFDCDAIGDSLVTVTLGDTSCTVTVSVRDTIAPVFTSLPTPQDSVYECENDLPLLSDFPSLLDATDNCIVAGSSSFGTRIVTDGEVSPMHGLVYVFNPPGSNMVDILDGTMAPLDQPSGSPVANLILTSFSSPEGFRRWRARNTNSFPVEVRVQPAGGSGPVFYFEAPANTDAFFLTDAVGGANTTIIQWLDESGTQRQTVKASSNQTFPVDEFDIVSEFCATLCYSWFATDLSGNSVMYMINYSALCDVEPPVIVCEDIDVFLDENGAAVIANDDAIISITDNCTDLADITGPFTIGGSGARTFSCDDIGNPRNIMVIATDESDNTDTCTYVATTLDTIAPLIFGNDTILYLDEMGMASLTIDDVAQDTVENCTVVDAELFLGDTIPQTVTLMEGIPAGGNLM